MRLALPFALMLFAAGALCAADEQPVQPVAPLTIDQRITQILDLRAKQSDLKKQEDTATAELKAELKRQQDLLDKLLLPDVKPPVPPVPPKPPEPVDPLRSKLKTAFDEDSTPLAQRRERAKDLAALYRQAAKLASDPAVTTSGELLRKVREAAGTLVGADALKEVRRVAGMELAGILPTDAALTAAQREQAEQVFKRLAEILEEIAK